MVVSVDLDVAVEVPAKGLEGTAEARVLIADEAAEHVGDEVFAAEGERGGDAVRVSGVDDTEGLLDEVPGRFRHGGMGECALKRETRLEMSDEGFDRAG